MSKSVVKAREYGLTREELVYKNKSEGVKNEKTQ